jgi:hypothetical protein
LHLHLSEQAADFSRTLLTRWGQVVAVAKQLPNLFALKLAGNLFHKLPIEGHGSDYRPLGSSLNHMGAFPTLKALDLNDCTTHIVDVQAVCRATPVLEVLRLARAGVARLDPSGGLRLIAPNFVPQPLRLPTTLTTLELGGNVRALALFALFP